MRDRDLSEFKRIKDFMTGESDQLSPVLAKKLDRYIDLFTLVKKHGTNRQQIMRFYRILKKKDVNAPRDTYEDVKLRRDINFATKLFGDVDRVNKNALRIMLQDDLMEDINTFKAMQVKERMDAEQEGRPINANRYGEFFKLKVSAMKTLIKATGLETADPDVPDYDKLEKHEYTITVDPALEGLLQKQLGAENKAAGALDLTSMFNRESIQDLDFDELKNDKIESEELEKPIEPSTE